LQAGVNRIVVDQDFYPAAVPYHAGIYDPGLADPVTGPGFMDVSTEAKSWLVFFNKGADRFAADMDSTAYSVGLGPERRGVGHENMVRRGFGLLISLFQQEPQLFLAVLNGGVKWGVIGTADPEYADTVEKSAPAMQADTLFRQIVCDIRIIEVAGQGQEAVVYHPYGSNDFPGRLSVAVISDIAGDDNSIRRLDCRYLCKISQIHMHIANNNYSQNDSSWRAAEKW
jgi:hypothetical protein